jgi:hypothetical protein
MMASLQAYNFIADAYPIEQARCRELLVTYRGLPNGVGVFGATMISDILKEADEAAIAGDLVKMLLVFQKMKACE